MFHRAVVVLVLVFTACSFSGASSPSDDPEGGDGDGVDAGALEDAANGQADAAPAPDADPTNPDDDGDGVLDVDDNCPLTKNAGQFDEDGDDVGDACDNCPHVRNSDQRDDSENAKDGVGNECDPNPNGSDTLYFDGFNDEQPLDWTLGVGWDIRNGRLQQDNALVESSALITLPGFSAAGVALTRARLISVNADTLSATRLAGIAAPTSSAVNHGTGCALNYDRASTETALSAYYRDELNLMINSIPTAFSFSSPQLIEASHDGGSLSCEMSGLIVEAQTIVVASEIGLYTRDSEARFDWFVAIVPDDI